MTDVNGNRNDNNLINESDKLFITVLLLQIKRNKCCDVDFSLHDKISYEILKSSNHFVPLIAVASKCIRQENEIDESNVSKEDMKDEYNETIADVDDGTMSEASDSERCEGVAVEEGVVGEAMRHVDKGTGDTGGTPEDDPVGGSERQVDKETVGCDVGVTKEDDLVGGSERQVDKEIVGCDVGVTKEKGLISGSERQVNKETERSDIGGTQGEGLVCGIEKQDDRMIERCGGLQSEVRTERDITK